MVNSFIIIRKLCQENLKHPFINLGKAQKQTIPKRPIMMLSHQKRRKRPNITAAAPAPFSPSRRRRKATAAHPISPAAAPSLNGDGYGGMEETARQLIARLAATPDSAVRGLPFLHRALTLPLLSAASAALRLSLLLSRLRPRRALPVPVVSVGNLTWGGNGKTPMVEFLARSFHRLGVSPLILTRVKLLSLPSLRHFLQKLGYIAFSVGVGEQF